MVQKFNIIFPLEAFFIKQELYSFNFPAHFLHWKTLWKDKNHEQYL